MGLALTRAQPGDETIAGGAAGDSLQPSETLTVTVAVDKVAAMAEAEVADAVRPTDELLCMALPQEEGEEVCAWLSTQGAANPNPHPNPNPNPYPNPNPHPNPNPNPNQVCAWLSTQGALRLCFASAAGVPVGGQRCEDGGGKGEEAADAAHGGADLAAAAGRVRLGSLLPPPTSPALPPLLPTPSPPSAAAAEEEDSIQLGLHALFSGSLPQDS